MANDPTAVLRAQIAARQRVEPDPLEREVVELFEQFRERLMRYLSGFGLPVCDCEEIVQETFLSLFRHLRDGKSRENLRAWLFRVSHNLGLKRRSRNLRSAEAIDGDRADPAPSAEARLMRSQKCARVLAVVRALPEQDRRCLALRAEGLRYREIAETLDISLGSVSMSLARSLAKIARAEEV